MVRDGCINLRVAVISHLSLFILIGAYCWGKGSFDTVVRGRARKEVLKKSEKEAEELGPWSK